MFSETIDITLRCNTEEAHYLKYNKQENQCFEFKHSTSSHIIDDLKNEYAILTFLHNHSIKVKRPICFTENNSSFTAKYQYIPGDSLSNMMMLERYGLMDIDLKMKCYIALFLTTVIQKCHKIGFIITLLSPECIKIDKYYFIYIDSLDNGTSNSQITYSSTVLNQRYCSKDYQIFKDPDIDSCNTFDESVDSYWFGVLLFSLFYKIDVAEHMKNNSKQYHCVKNLLFSNFTSDKKLDQPFYHEMKSLIGKLLDSVKKERCTIHQFKSDFLKLIDKYADSMEIDANFKEWQENGERSKLNQENLDLLRDLEECCLLGFIEPSYLLAKISLFMNNTNMSNLLFQRCIDIQNEIGKNLFYDIDNYYES
ncbi:hypothetical protein TRFO_01405 [Tritrichomonas foetus]|uniref:Protein kinase domain-containing protein n=1 Tax=Tritrichomonas foetus TaxID=1144522 RepID=A0A1J4K774_9EUKA|nr:hypothetical protein TRFO_01405 [Tritrichomonas foetus]|eukprot:OHT07231.1 hypothetical protein TRFO_01405 [Tritrichomonas foetus]